MTNLARQTFASLKVRNYRVFFFGMLVSASGTWMQQVAQGWLVLKLTNSGTLVGLVTAMQFVPMMVGGTWGGVLADRFDKRHLLYITQSWMALTAGGLAIVTLTHIVTIWMVFVAAFLMGCATVVDNPTRQAFVSELVGPDNVPNAVALNSAMFNSARIVGPALAGLLILVAGTGTCFAYNSISFVAVLISLTLMRPSELYRGKPVGRAKGQIRAGLAYAWHTPELRSTILLVAIVGTFTLNFTVLMPLLAKFTFHAGPGTLGIVTSAMGAGSLVGALTAAARSKPTPTLLIGASAALGLAMFGVAASPSLPVAIFVLALAGGATITFLSTANSMLQLSSSSEMRGRVMSLYLIVFLGSTPIGGPIVGWIAQHYSTRLSFAVGGVAAVVGAVLSAHGLFRARRRGLVVEPTLVADVVGPGTGLVVEGSSLGSHPVPSR